MKIIRNGIIGLSEIAAIVERSRAWAYEFTTAPDFPRPVAFVGRVKFWRKADVIAWKRGRIARGGDRPGRPRKKAA